MTTTYADLHAVLLARIEELEAVARAATPGPWLLHAEPSNSELGEMYWVYSASHGVAVSAERPECGHLDIERTEVQRGRPDAELVAAHGPDAVLRGLAEDRDNLRVAMDLEAMAVYHEELPHPGPMTAAALRNTACRLVRSLARRHGIEVPS